MVDTVRTPTADILAELERILDPARFEDYCVNGLQVPGCEQVETIATGVSASAELFARAAAEQAQLLVVHHGLFWGSGARTIDATMARRLKLLLGADMALAAYHLPLDAHPELGNNAQLARGLGATGSLEPFPPGDGAPIGFVAVLPGDGLTPAELLVRVDELTGCGQSANHHSLLLQADAQSSAARIRRLAIVSGAGADYLSDAAAAGADALLTGEAEERSMALARELGIHLLAAGHYATETFGVRRLGEHLAERFGVRHVFLDVPNPV
ncbi:MAG: Nif3-like dinuclear metal center hexameric protein [Solirubrobacteraceae bacterium]